MSMPAGWHDDGSGRQRWWDGQRWTEHVAPAPGGPAPAHPTSVQGVHGAGAWTTAPPAATARVSPVLGFVGLGLAALGTVMACIPATFFVGAVVLLAAFVVSLVGLLRKGAAKWPSVVGMVLSVVGGAVGTVLVLVVAVSALAGTVAPPAPVATPSSTPTAQPSAPSAPVASPPSGARPAPEEIAVGLEQLALDGGATTYSPDFFLCMGQYLYDSELSDEALQTAAGGEDIVGAERDLAIEVTTEAALACDP